MATIPSIVDTVGADGEVADFLQEVETEAKRFNVANSLEGDRYKLAFLNVGVMPLQGSGRFPMVYLRMFFLAELYLSFRQVYGNRPCGHILYRKAKQLGRVC